MVIRVKVENDEKIVRKLKAFGFKVSDLKDAWQKIGNHIKNDAIPLTPVLTGALANTLRVGKAKSMAVVRAGNARMVYAPIQHYGGYNNIEGKRFLTAALLQNQDTAVEEVDREIDRLIRRSGLK